MQEKHEVIIVGGGLIGAFAAYWLSQRGRPVTLLDQFEIPNRWASSGDHLRVFKPAFGKDVFHADLALKSLPLWLDLNEKAGETILQQNGMLELATLTHGVEEAGFNALRELKASPIKMDKEALHRTYPMFNTRAIKYGILHKQGGMLWPRKAVAALSSMAQRKGARFKHGVRIVAVLKDKKQGIHGLRDSAGHVWEAERYIFACGPWTPEILKPYRLPIKTARRFQMYLRPIKNRGRYRPEHFPPFSIQSAGFHGFPMHLHGFLKITEENKGPYGAPGPGGPTEAPPAFERKCRAVLKRFVPELASFSEFESSVRHDDVATGRDFILDRLPDAPNSLVAAGFSGNGLSFAPIIGKTLCDLSVGAEPEINVHRFRLTK